MASAHLNRIALDTNAYCQCDLGIPQAIDALAQARQIYLPIVTYGELYYGFRHGSRQKKNLQRLSAFVDEFDVRLVQVDQDVAEVYGDICAALRKRGRPLPSNDIWIAACARSVDATLLTSDNHFAEIGNLVVEWLDPV